MDLPAPRALNRGICGIVVGCVLDGPALHKDASVRAAETESRHPATMAALTIRLLMRVKTREKRAPASDRMWKCRGSGRSPADNAGNSGETVNRRSARPAASLAGLLVEPDRAVQPDWRHFDGSAAGAVVVTKREVRLAGGQLYGRRGYGRSTDRAAVIDGQVHGGKPGRCERHHN